MVNSALRNEKPAMALSGSKGSVASTEVID